MTNQLEKRNTTRHPIKGPITLRSTIGASTEIHANLLNFSEQGICFSASQPLIPGTTILFKASADTYVQPANDADGQLRSISLVTVKWCKENPKQGQPVHEMGATYLVQY